MRAGKKPSSGMGGGSMQKQLQQMQAMQRKMEMLQAEIDEKEVETTAGGGAVTAVVNGRKEIVRLEIKPEVVDPDDVEMLQELLAFLVAFQGVDGVEPGAHLLVDFLVVAGYHGHVVLVLLLVGFLLDGSGVVGSVDA